LKIDLGCGNYPRGDIGVTLKQNTAVCNATPHLDKYLEPYGFVYNPKAQIIYDDLENYIQINYPTLKGQEILMCHILEHLTCPYCILSALDKAKMIVIVTPNARVNDADKTDKTHIYSFTEWSLENLINTVFKADYKIYKIENDYDLLAVIYPH